MQARRLLLAAIPTIVVSAIFLGGREASILALLLNWMYNDLQGGDESYDVRHLVNALGLTFWSVGTTLVACGKDHCWLSMAGYCWLATGGAIVFTTVHLMDLRDQAGERAHGRTTVPISLGDTAARWTVMNIFDLCPCTFGTNGRGRQDELEPLGSLDGLHFLATIAQ